MGDTQLLLEEKQRLRERGKRARAALSPAQRRAFSAAVCRALMEHPAFQTARRVMSYAAFGAELSLDDLPELAPDTEFFYPLCLPERQMEALRPLSDDGWCVGAYGIRTPVPERSQSIHPAELDLVLVPLVAYDRQCRRLGMGGGYYDRFLPRCTLAVKLGVAFSCQEAERVPAGEYDVPLDGVVTERGRRAAAGNRPAGLSHCDTAS